MRASPLPASKAEPIAPLPTAGGAIRAALSDFFYNSLRLVAANLIWGAGLILLVGLTLTYLPAALVTLILLALPTAGIFRLAALIAREEPATFSDSLDAWRRYLVPTLGIGLAVGGGSVVLTFNAMVGFLSTDAVGVAFGTAALWGLVATWAVALAFWPLLVDPRRADQPVLARLRLSVTVIFVAPGRYALLFLAMLIVTIVSTVAFAALITVTVSFVALVMCRYVLPAADRLDSDAEMAR